ncbi:hypothetical protein EDD86DRAFT_212352 [Gorgonomyces haynaldii]|nr:hypothetical protein EDD86DRAFT_212352 [Gorgonomyces haynaldii]
MPTTSFVSSRAVLNIRIASLFWVLFNMLVPMSSMGFIGYFLFFTDFCWLGIGLLLGSGILEHTMSIRLPYLHRILFSTATTLSWIVTIVFWVLLGGAIAQQDGFLNKVLIIAPHTLNFVFSQAELWLTRHKLEWSDFVWPILAQTLYTLYAMIMNGLGYPYVYPFLRDMMAKGDLGEIVFAILLSIVSQAVFFAINKQFIRLRDQWAKPKQQ